jgi:metal-responsive CopG/Arc/MetJ family transcriptional regulator
MEHAMATVNFSVPEEVKKAFNEAFAGRNKSAIIAELMMQAVAEREKMQRRAGAIDRLLARRPERPVVAEGDIQAARDELREWP